MDKQQKKQVKKYLTYAVITLVVLILAVMPLLAANAPSDGPQASILTAEATVSSIGIALIGGGQLSSEATEKVTIPEEVKLTEYLVGNGDILKKGDPIAAVDTVSVMMALSEVQETLDYLSDELSDAGSDSDEVKAHAGGFIKTIYGQPGDSVRDVMLEHGALAVLSLDGRMAVEIQRSTDLKPGDTVCVSLPDDTEVDGTVESAAGGLLTVSIEDKGYATGETVIVTTQDGNRLGRGQLYIHNAWNAAAYYGTISEVKAKEGDTIAPGKTLFELEIGDYSAQFQILAARRQEYEELMQELFTLYHTGVITAPCDGIVTGVDTNGAFLLSASGAEQDWFVQLLANTEEASPDVTEDTQPTEPPEETEPTEPEVPATAYSVLVGQVTADDNGTLILKAYPEAVTCSNLNEIRVDTGLMTATIARNINGTVIWEKDLVSVHSDAIETGDILFFVTGSNGSSYVVWAGNQSVQPGGSGQQMGSNMGAAVGGMPGGSMGSNLAPAFEPYSLETLTVACVTSQEQMTLEITVDEQDIAKLRSGQNAIVTMEALTGQSFPAVISSIGNTGTNEGGSSKFTATLILSKSGDMLPGMNASAYLTLGTAENVLTLPVAALVEDGTRTLVYTGCDEKEGILTDPVEVITGVSDGETVQILSGLSEGDTVFYEYYDTLEISFTPEAGNFPFR